MTTVDYETMSVEQLREIGAREVNQLPGEHRAKLEPLLDAFAQRAMGQTPSGDYANVDVAELKEQTTSAINNVPGEQRQKITSLFDALFERAKGWRS